MVKGYFEPEIPNNQNVWSYRLHSKKFELLEENKTSMSNSASSNQTSWPLLVLMETFSALVAQHVVGIANLVSFNNTISIDVMFKNINEAQQFN